MVVCDHSSFNFSTLGLVSSMSKISTSGWYPTVKQESLDVTDEREKEWMEGGSPSHVALTDIVMNKLLLKKIPYYQKCR